jgi:hypothetical protein
MLLNIPGAGRFREWRRSRPFWGGVLTMLAGLVLLWAPLAPLHVVLVQGIAGIASLVLAALLVAMGALSWFQPQLRAVLGVTTVVLALASFLLSNLGGFLVGMVLGIVGGALMFSWVPRAVAATVALVLALATSAEAVPATHLVHFTALSIATTGLDYTGVVEVPGERGPVPALRLTMDTLTISHTDLTTGGVRMRDGATTLRGGVELYVTSFSGLLFGVVPVLFTPHLPPPIVPKAASFTLVRAEIRYLRADHARLPSLRQQAQAGADLRR